MPVNGLEEDLDKVLSALADMCASAGDTTAVAILAMSTPSIRQTNFDGWDGGQTYFTISLELPQSFYRQLEGRHDEIANTLKERVKDIERLYEREWIDAFEITTELENDPNWRDKAKAYVAGQGISNQGRVRSDNLAPRMVDGLLFRSLPEIFLYRAFKSLGVTFAPLPVFVRGGIDYRRIEPDFVVLKDGMVMIIEVDGDTVHRETPLEAHNRTTMLVHEGAHVERVNANDCASAEKAMACAKRLLEILSKLKEAR